jgi:hypothetical protein
MRFAGSHWATGSVCTCQSARVAAHRASITRLKTRQNRVMRGADQSAIVLRDHLHRRAHDAGEFKHRHTRRTRNRAGGKKRFRALPVGPRSEPSDPAAQSQRSEVPAERLTKHHTASLVSSTPLSPTRGTANTWPSLAGTPTPQHRFGRQAEQFRYLPARERRVAHRSSRPFRFGKQSAGQQRPMAAGLIVFVVVCIAVAFIALAPRGRRSRMTPQQQRDNAAAALRSRRQRDR